MATITLARQVTVELDNLDAAESIATIRLADPSDPSYRGQEHEISGSPQALYALAMGLLAGLDPNHHVIRAAARGRTQRPVPE